MRPPRISPSPVRSPTGTPSVVSAWAVSANASAGTAATHVATVSTTQWPRTRARAVATAIAITKATTPPRE